MGYLGSFFGIEAAKHQQEEQANNQQRTEFCLSDQVPQKMATLLDANELAATTKMYMECSGIRTDNARTAYRSTLAGGEHGDEETSKSIEQAQRKSLITAVDKLETKAVGCDFTLIEETNKVILEISGKECSWTGAIE